MIPRDVQPVEPITISVRLLGRMTATIRGRDLRLTGRHAQALFALLVLRPRPRSREGIAADLWPEADPRCAGSLRQALWLLRGALSGADVDPDRVIDANPESIGLRRDVIVDLDATVFEKLVRDRPAQPEAALLLYDGDLAEGLGHECFAADRERLADAYEDALALASAKRLEIGDVDGARAAAEELLLRDPLREEAHEVLIRVFGSTGSRAQVVRQFRRLETLLDAEIGVTPLPETVAAFRSALDQTVDRSHLRVAGIGGGGAVGAVARPVLVESARVVAMAGRR